jgi:hypothetical protein
LFVSRMLVELLGTLYEVDLLLLKYNVCGMMQITAWWKCSAVTFSHLNWDWMQETIFNKCSRFIAQLLGPLFQETNWAIQIYTNLPLLLCECNHDRISCCKQNKFEEWYWKFHNRGKRSRPIRPIPSSWEG